MRVRLSGFVILLGCAFFRIDGSAQTVENVVWSVSIDVNGRKTYIITYDLLAAHANIPCLIKLKLFSGEREFYLRFTSGDVGNNISPGPGRRVVWDFEEELVHFKGEVSIEVEAYPMLNVSANVKRGNDLGALMRDHSVKGKNYAIKLVRKEKEVLRLNDMMMIDSAFNITIPRKTKVGSDYQLQMTDGKTVYFSNTFRVKPKVGIFWKVAPLLVVPIYFLINKGIDDNATLPAPPEIKGS